MTSEHPVSGSVTVGYRDRRTTCMYQYGDETTRGSGNRPSSASDLLMPDKGLLVPCTHLDSLALEQGYDISRLLDGIPRSFAPVIKLELANQADARSRIERTSL